MMLKDWLRKKVLSFLGMSKYEGTPGDDRLTFVNDEDTIIKTKIRENNIWYGGDGDELLNFYTRQNTIDYNYEPWYDRNKRNYFWSVSSTEEDIKRTHSGQPRNIVDTLVAVIGKPDIQGGPEELGRENEINKNMDKLAKTAKVLLVNSLGEKKIITIPVKYLLNSSFVMTLFPIAGSFT